MTDKLCIAPFVHSHVSAKYERKLCCVAKTIPGMDKTSTEEYWNSDYVKQARLDMMAGKELPDCSFCYDHEKNNRTSLRQQLNAWYDVSEIVSQTLPDGAMPLYPSYFDVRSIRCNMHCVTCDDNHSSKHFTIAKEVLGRNSRHVIDPEYENGLAQEIIQGLLTKTTKHIYWAGGEPLITQMHWTVIDKMEELLEDPEYTDYIRSIQMFYNTNMTKLERNGRLIPEILAKFDTTIWTSMDGIERTFEYCRDGGTWEKIRGNWLEYKKYVPKSGITAVLSAPVLMDIEKLVNFLEEHQASMFNHEYAPNDYINLMDIRLWPQHLFDEIIDNAEQILTKTSLQGKEYTLSILDKYREEKKTFPVPDYAFVKQQIQKRDKFLRYEISFENLLKHIHENAYEWYSNI